MIHSLLNDAALVFFALFPVLRSLKLVIKYSAWIKRSATWRCILMSSPPPRAMAKPVSEGRGVHPIPEQPATVTASACSPPNRAWTKGVTGSRRKERRGPNINVKTLPEASATPPVGGAFGPNRVSW